MHTHFPLFMPIADSSLLHHICSPFSLVPKPSHAFMYIITLPCITISYSPISPIITFSLSTPHFFHAFRFLTNPFHPIPLLIHILIQLHPLKPIPLSKPSYFFSHHLFSLYTTYSPCIPISHSTFPTHSTVPLPMNLFLALSLEHMTHMHDCLDACMPFLEDTDRFGLNLGFFLRKKGETFL